MIMKTNFTLKENNVFNNFLILLLTKVNKFKFKIINKNKI